MNISFPIRLNMGVIRVRVDDEDQKILEEAGLDVSELVRQIIHERARRLRQRQIADRLSANAADVTTRSEDLVREGRDD